MLKKPSSAAELPDRRWAVLIDAENVRPDDLPNVLSEIVILGNVVVKRVYGDFSHPVLQKWKTLALTFGLAPVHCFRSVSGKSNSDMALAIDAMDQLHSGNIDGICLVTSDSDFAPLAMRIREAGLLVYGFGEHKTPKALVSACHRFWYTEHLERNNALRAMTQVQQEDSSTPANDPTITTSTSTQGTSDENNGGDELPWQHLKEEFRRAIDDLSDVDGWAQLGAVGHMLGRRFSAFSARNYKYNKLTDLAKAIGCEVTRRDKTVCVRFNDKDNAA